MDSDRNLQHDVIEALEWEPGIEASRIDVSVEEGTVTLGGTVKAPLERSMAVQAVERVRGVRGVVNELIVRLVSSSPSDAAIAEAVANALAWDSAVPPNAIEVEVADGWVTLTGSVEWQSQKSAAQIAAERMTGVKSVVNLILLAPRVRAANVKANIEKAFLRHARVDASRIDVETHGGYVILRGTVRSLIERKEAERAVWSEPGVNHIDDRLIVAPGLTT